MKVDHRLETLWLHTTTLRIQQSLIIWWYSSFNWRFTILAIIYNWFILTVTVKRHWIPLSARFVVPFYMFCIGLMMADLRPKHVALMWTDIKYFITVWLYICVLTAILLIMFLLASSWLPVYMKQLDNQRHGFHEICQWVVLLKICDTV
jgi:Flp pilus assembly protein protease CpaA